MRPPGLELALEPVLVPVQPLEPAQTRLHAAPAAAGSASASRKSSRSFNTERLGGAHAHRTQLQQAQIRDDADAQIAVCEQHSSSAERGDARALAQPPKKSTLGESMICTIIIHTRHKNVNITTHKITKEDEITGVSITTLHDVMHVESHRVIVT